MTKPSTFRPLTSPVPIPVRPSVLFPPRLASGSEITNIRQPGFVAGVLVEDATDYRAQLRARGAFPKRARDGWNFQTGVLRDLAKDYYDRSSCHRYRGARDDLGNGYLFTNEPGYHSAIGAIEARGGAYVGVGQMLYTLSAWQGAAHAYGIDINARVPTVALPLNGVLRAMAADRFEFLSLIYGRSVPKTPEWAELIDGQADILVESLKALPRNLSFESSVQNAVRVSMAGYEALYGKSEIADTALSYLTSFREAIDSERPFPHSNTHPLSILKAADDEGRGGTLSSEAQFRRERDIFIDGRITGVASPLEGDGLAAIAADMAARGISLGALNISNVEDWLFEDYERASRGDGRFDLEETGLSILYFYGKILDLFPSPGSLLISAKGCCPTIVGDLRRYVAGSIPLDAPLDEAVRSADLLYALRREETRVRRDPLKSRPKLLEKYGELGPVFTQIFAAIRQGWKGVSLPREEAEAALLDRSHHFRETLTAWERGAVLRVLQDSGIVARDEV